MRARAVTAAQQISLHCHPASSCVAVDDIRVTLQRLSDAQLQLSYLVSGELSHLRVPFLTKAERRDELWRHTCAELFVAEPNQAAYGEFNFSPSACWAAYEFGDYRQGMRPAKCEPPAIVVRQAGQTLQIETTVQLPENFAAAEKLQLSVTMVIEDNAGQYSYWAVQHAPVKPDFHWRPSFVLDI